MTDSKGIRPPYPAYEKNQALIIEALEEIYNETGNDLPPYKEIAARTGLSTRTVYKHYQNLDFGYIVKRERVHTPKVVQAIRRSAEAGKSKAQKLYAQMMEKFVEKKSTDNKVVGDLKTNSNVSGELTVNLVKKVVFSKEELQSLKGGNKPPATTKRSEAASKLVEDNDEKVEKAESELKERSIAVVGEATVQLLGAGELDII